MDDAELESRIAARFQALGGSVSQEELSKLSAYFGLLTKWNSTINLTAFALSSVSQEAIDRLVVEPFMAAVFAAEWLETTPGDLLVDLGSGGGSPAIPLKIGLPHLKLIMVESRGRKATFLREAVRSLGLSSAEVLNVRIEALSGLADRIGAGFISVRAVRTDVEFWESARSLLRPDGRVLWFRTDPSQAAASQGEAKFPEHFVLETIHPLVGTNRSQLAILRRLP